MNSVLGPERPATISSGMPGRFVLAAGSRPPDPTDRRARGRPVGDAAFPCELAVLRMWAATGVVKLNLCRGPPGRRGGSARSAEPRAAVGTTG